MTTLTPAYHFAHYKLSFSKKIPVQKTLPLADIIRKQLLRGEGWYTFGELSPTFSGKNNDLSNQLDHIHAFIMPMDTTNNGSLDQLLVYSPIGFSIPALVALDRLQRETFFDSTSLQLREISQNTPSSFQMKSKRWRSVTPLLSFRHYKKNIGTEQDWWEEEVDRFCQAQKLPTTVSVSLLKKPPKTSLRWREFSLKRPSKPQNQIPQYTGLEIEFKKPQSFPLCLGEYCHFGMGRFEPCE